MLLPTAPAATIMRVTVRRSAKTQPLINVTKLAKEGWVMDTANGCNNASKELTRYMASFLSMNKVD